MKTKKLIALGLMFVFVLMAFSGCGNGNTTSGDASNAASAVSDVSEVSLEPVTLNIAGGWEDCKAIDDAARAFSAEHSNVTVVYEYVQEYNASVETRLDANDNIDMFFTTNIQGDNAFANYALDLSTADGLDLTDNFEGLIQNFVYREGDNSNNTKLYAVPIGAEMRGLYVNKTLLDSFDIDMPTNQETLLAACAKLKENGITPLQGNPSYFAQILVYPWICNNVANAADYEAAYTAVDTKADGYLELFREPYEFLYSLVTNYYYDYKGEQGKYKNADGSGGLFTDASDNAYAKYFFNIIDEVKADDKGVVAFMPAPLSLTSSMDKVKDDYHSEIEYVFIPAPVSKDGGFVYMSPAHGIAINKNSENLEWAVKFLDFLMTPENNEAFAAEFNVLPNTKDTFDYIKTLYDVNEDHISHLGQVTFSYDFYKEIVDVLVDISKANNPKYMKPDESGTVVYDDKKVVVYPFDYFWDQIGKSEEAE